MTSMKKGFKAATTFPDVTINLSSMETGGKVGTNAMTPISSSLKKPAENEIRKLTPPENHASPANLSALLSLTRKCK